MRPSNKLHTLEEQSIQYWLTHKIEKYTQDSPPKNGLYVSLTLAYSIPIRHTTVHSSLAHYIAKTHSSYIRTGWSVPVPKMRVAN
jgi:hypothetical protein